MSLDGNEGSGVDTSAVDESDQILLATLASESLTRWVYAAPSDGSGAELWVTDGTEPGTVLLKDIYPAGGASSPTNFTVMDDGRVPFVAGTVSDGHGQAAQERAQDARVSGDEFPGPVAGGDDLFRGCSAPRQSPTISSHVVD